MTDSNPDNTAAIHVDTGTELGRIDRNVYGHFLESNFFGNIEGGVLDEDSPLSIDAAGQLMGMRQDVIDACRELEIPVVRWPGGNFTSAYHWTDGIGPRDDRPRRLDLTWGGEESNRFGTDEFLAWCEAIGSEAYLAHSCRSVDDAVRWVEYTNYGGDTALSRQRAVNGRKQPWHVRYWGVGNEVYGPWQMGHRSAERYAIDAREHARFMRLVDPTIRLIGVGQRDEEWTRHLIQRAGSLFDYLSIHLYGASNHLFAGGTDRDHYEAMVAQSIHFEEELRAYSGMVSTLARQAGVEKPLALALDEWSMRHLEPASWPDPQPGDEGGIADRAVPDVDPDSPGALRVNRWSPRTLADALFYAGVFHSLHRLSGLDVPPTMANTVNLVNANALLAVRPRGLVRTATWHVWRLLGHHTGPIAVPVRTESGGHAQDIVRDPRPDRHGQFASRTGHIPDLDASASLSADRQTLHLSVINRHPERRIVAAIRTKDGTPLPSTASVHDLGADATSLLASNSIDNPDAVAVRELGNVQLRDGQFPFPPHSISVLAFSLD